MPYTVWSRGRLLGYSNLAYAPPLPWIRAGEFELTDAGESLLPILTGLAPALEALADVLDADVAAGRSRPRRCDREALRLTTEFADVLSVSDRLAQLELELRDSDGALVPTASMGVQDTEHILALARRDGVLDDEDELEPWQPKPARYQLIVRLEPARSVPSRR